MKKDTNNQTTIDNVISSLSKNTAKTPASATENPTPTIEDKMQMLPVSSLEAFKSHPYKILENEDFAKLTESIRESGVLIPAIARPKGDGFELIAGHRRKAVCEKLGIDAMPVIVREMTDEQATITMVDSNVQRENILPSEKAFAYKMKMDAMKRQGQRSDLTSTPLAWKSKGQESAAIIGEASGESKDQVRRYIRLTELNPQLLKMVDEKQIAFRPAVELSYLTKTHQKLLLSAMDSEQSTPSLSQAQKLKLYSQDGILDESKIVGIMKEQKPNQRECIKISYDNIKQILQKDVSVKEIEDVIFRAITDYGQKLQAQKQRGIAR